MWRSILLFTILVVGILREYSHADNSVPIGGEHIDYAPICYKEVCGSIVTYCLLSGDCRCDVKQNVTCAEGCGQCLGYLYTNCCVCAKLCTPRPFEGIGSTVEYIKEPDSELFSLIVNQASDKETRWTSYTYPVELVTFEDAVEPASPTMGSESTHRNESVSCTVAFVNQATNLHKCSITCNSMGATSYRFFSNGCCECVGQFCPNFGIDDPKCDFPNKDFKIPSLLVDETEYTEEFNSDSI